MSTIKPYIFYDAIMAHKPTLLKPKIVRVRRTEKRTYLVEHGSSENV